MSEHPRRLIDVLKNPSQLIALLGEYFKIGRWRKQEPVTDSEALRTFLNTRASYVGQYSLYSYLRTRAGSRYPELFDDDPFVVSINIAKWHVWLACLSDLVVYAGGLLYRLGGANSDAVTRIMTQLVDEILDETGTPGEAGGEFAAHAVEVRRRIANCNWANVTDDEGPFTASPDALIKWAPIVDDLKELDDEIVRNSIRFRWQKVRRDLREALDSAAILTGFSGAS